MCHNWGEKTDINPNIALVKIVKTTLKALGENFKNGDGVYRVLRLELIERTTNEKDLKKGRNWFTGCGWKIDILKN